MRLEAYSGQSICTHCPRVSATGRIEYAQEVGVYSGMLKTGIELTAELKYVQ